MVTIYCGVVNDSPSYCELLMLVSDLFLCSDPTHGFDEFNSEANHVFKTEHRRE